MIPIQNKEVETKFSSYPKHAEKALLNLRRFIFETASELGIKEQVEETLKWDQPSYRTRHGSTVRIDWDASTHEQYCMFFHCQTKLVATFKELYQDQFTFRGNRAIVFQTSKDIPEQALKHCISLALQYHRLKHLPLLGHQQKGN